MLKIAEVRNGEVRMTGTATVGIVALLGVLMPAVTSGVTAYVTLHQQESTTALEEAQLEEARRQAAAKLLREVLVQPDPQQREVFLRFLLAAGLIDPSSVLDTLTGDRIPVWPTEAPPPNEAETPGS